MERKKGAPNEEEVKELLREWKEEKRRPLAGDGGSGTGDDHGTIGGTKKRKGSKDKDGGGMSGLVVEKIVGSRLYFESESFQSYNNDNDNTTNNDKDFDKENNNASTTTTSNLSTKTNSTSNDNMPPSALNFATHDYLSTTSSPTLRTVARTALHHYGCGSCGPRGFYGTIDAHLEIESALSSYLGTEGAILYSDGASAATSTVAAFAKRGDLLIVDEGVSESLLVGVTLSRANVRYFRHNDVKDLRRVLEKVAAQDAALARNPTDQRRFLVVEGLYRNWGTIAPLREICKLKEEFCYRLILDDSHGIGTLGKHGRGSLEHAGLKPMIHAEIVTFSLENALGSVGGMTVGSEEVVDHQRLSGAGYCFSASAPPFLSKVCWSSVRRLEGRMEEVAKYLEEGDAGGDGGEDEEEESTREDALSQQPSDDDDELSGPALLTKLHENVSLLYTTLTNSSHPHALKLRNRLSITSHPLSPILYLRLADPEATGRTRAEQTSLLDRIAHRCLVKGGVAIVSTGGHVKKYLQSVPEPSLRLVAHVNQTREEVEVLVEALGEGVESVLVNNDGDAMD